MSRTLDPEKREKFLNAALHLFVTQGVQRTSTAEIASTAGTAAGTLFLYFPSKEDLVNSLLLDIARAQSDAVKTLLSPLMSPRESFLTIWDSTIHWFLAHPEAYLYVLQVRDSGIVAESVVQETALYFDYYYSTIQQGLAQQEIKPYPLDLIGDILYHDLVAVMNTLLRQTNTTEKQEISRMGFDIFWSGIRKS